MSDSGDWVAPGYTEIRELGSGATGRVVLAREDAGGRLVAIKYLAPRLVGDQVFAERFRREAELMELVRDPHVVEMYALLIAPDGLGVALVMEAVEGPTLRTLLSQGHGSPEAALALLRGSLLGLAAAHDRGVVHRDYKPDNVLVDANGESKLTDFGIAAPAWEGGAPAEGTPAYMAPEQWNGYPPAPASDMYSAAVVFYECLTGVRPFRSETLAELRTLHESAPPPLGQVPPPVRGLVERGLAKYPQERYGDVRTFLADVEAAAVAGYGADWLERGVRDLAYVAAGLIAALPLLALAAGTTAAGTIGLAGAAGAAGATGAAGAAGAAGAGTGAAGTGAAGAGAAGLGHAATQAGIQGAVQAGQAGGQAAGHAATQAAAHLGAQAAGHGAAAQAFGGVAAGHGAAAAQAFGEVGHAAVGHAAVHGSTAAGQVLGSASGNAAQAAQNTRRAARWTRHGSKLLHGKALAATVATVTVAAAGTGAVVAATGGGDAKTTVAQAEESTLHDFGRGDYAAMCGEMSAALLKLYSGADGCRKLMASANGFVSSVGTSLADERKAASAATVDASQVTVTGDTAVVPASAVHISLSNIKVLGQSIQLHMNDVTWVKEGGHWKIGMPKGMPSDLPTDLFPSGSIPTGLFPTDLPTSLLGNLPTDLLSDLPSGFPSDFPTEFPTG